MSSDTTNLFSKDIIFVLYQPPSTPNYYWLINHSFYHFSIIFNFHFLSMVITSRPLCFPYKISQWVSMVSNVIFVYTLKRSWLLFRRSIYASIFPFTLKFGSIRSILKSGDFADVTNFDLITILIYKKLENCIQDYLRHLY